MGNELPEIVDEMTTEEEQEKYDEISKKINNLYKEFDSEKLITDNSFKFIGVPDLDNQQKISRVVYIPLTINFTSNNSIISKTKTKTKTKPTSGKK